MNHIIHLGASAEQENNTFDSFSGDGTEDHYVDMTKTTSVSDSVPIGLPSDLSELILVIDGEKVTMEEFQELKPSDIKSMTILKGEPAIKIWGAEAVNGVIEVKTNK